MPGKSNTSSKRARHKQHECDTSETRVIHEWHECDTSATRVLHEQHQCYASEKILVLITIRVKRYFHIPTFTIWQVKDYKERNNFILSITFKNASFSCQMRLKIAPQKLNFVMVKTILKSYSLNCRCKFPWTFPHSYA